MKSIYAAEIILALCLAVPGDPPPEPKPVLPVVPDITGYYVCTGLESGGKKYHGITTIERRGETYVVTWAIGAGASFVGVGVRHGEYLSVSWAVPGQAQLIRGINMYRITGQGDRTELTGRWATLPGPGALQHEALTWLRMLPPVD